jgi:hypothetical protein
LIEELRFRGYKGKLVYTREVVVWMPRLFLFIRNAKFRLTKRNWIKSPCFSHILRHFVRCTVGYIWLIVSELTYSSGLFC